MTVPVPNPGKGRKLKKVTTSYQVQGGANKEPAGITIWKSGRALTNVDCADLLIPLVKQAGGDSNRFMVDFGVDKENQVIGVSIASPNTPGAMPAQPSGHEKTISFHLGGVFKDYPDLRPVGKRQYMVSLEPDDEGTMCLMIHLKSGVMKRTGTRGDGTGDSGQGAAAGEQQ
jgi:hypothetical protein